MAISKNLYTRGLQQRLAGAVWYQQKGRTLVRELAASVSNPQTEDQMNQRVKLANVVAAYRANKHWMERYAFENKKSVWSVYNAFVHYNLSENNIYLTKDEVDTGAAIVAEYIVTKGSLPTIEAEMVEHNSTWLLRSDINLSVSAIATAADLSTYLLQDARFQEGDQISLIINHQRVSGNVKYITCDSVEFIIDTTDTTLIDDIKFGEYINEVNGHLALWLDDTDDIATAACLVHSRDIVGGGVEVSTQRLILNTTDAQSDNTGDAAQRRARRSYGSGTTAAFLQGGYQESGDTPEPPSLPAIATAGIDNGTPVAPGSYLGVVPSVEVGLEWSIRLTFDPSVTETDPIESIEVEAGVSQGVTKDGEAISATYGGSTRVDFGSSDLTAGQPIKRIKVNLQSGNYLSASFAQQA